VGDYTTFYHFVNILKHVFSRFVQNFIIGRLSRGANSCKYKCLQRYDAFAALNIFFAAQLVFTNTREFINNLYQKIAQSWLLMLKVREEQYQI
jgi:hypothetical protein